MSYIVGNLHAEKNVGVSILYTFIYIYTIDPIFSSEADDILLPEKFLNNLGSFNITFTGNIGDAQNLDDILSAAKIIQITNPSIRIFIIGSGSKLEYYIDRVHMEEIRNLFFLGSLCRI